MINKIRLIIILLIFIPYFLLATSQIRDKINFWGEEYILDMFILEDYFETHPEKIPSEARMSTALYRKYVATFEIEDINLKIKSIRISVVDSSLFSTLGDQIWQERKWKDITGDIFHRKEQINMTWFSGFIIIPRGEYKTYHRYGYTTGRESYLVLEIYKGYLTQVKEFDNIEFIKFQAKQYEEFLKTEEYLEVRKYLIRHRDIPDDVDFIPDYIDRIIKYDIFKYSTKFLVD